MWESIISIANLNGRLQRAMWHLHLVLSFKTAPLQCQRGENIMIKYWPRFSSWLYSAFPGNLSFRKWHCFLIYGMLMIGRGAGTRPFNDVNSLMLCPVGLQGALCNIFTAMSILTPAFTSLKYLNTTLYHTTWIKKRWYILNAAGSTTLRRGH